VAHYHIRFLCCGSVNDLSISVDRRREAEAELATNYRVVSHQVEVLGVCSPCQSATKN
jgi:Fe2+ or Zn2+ uptake regulation protein